MFGGACGKKIVIEYRGKRATATIVDLVRLSFLLALS